VSFYDSWLARLRAREGSAWQRYKKGVFVVLLDAAVIITIAISASTLGPRLLDNAGIEGIAVPLVLLGVGALVATPFAISMIRRVAILARRLATELIPVGDPVDLGRAPRRALIVTFELGIALVISVPIVAAVQPFVPGSLILVLVVALLLLIAMRRSIKDFDGHVRAGSALILELLSTHQPQMPQMMPLSQVETLLPGFGGTSSIKMPPSSAAVGRSLAELDLRALTGATVLAIARGDHASGLATPSPTEPLRAGDVLALAGSEESIAKARELLTATSSPTDA
jgi:CPA2 family monovalent cation:H+ antiporter-2